MTQVITRDGFVPDRYADTQPMPLADYAGGGALLLSVEDKLSDVRRIIGALDLITIPFASSADGRGFSMAGSLRAMGYLGHLRARGHLLVDQFRAALSCGFDDIEIGAEQAKRNPEEQWISVPFEQSYQSHIVALDACR